LLAAWRRRRCWRKCWSASIAITPLYRQSQIFARHGVDLPRSTLAGWVGGACWWLEALHERLAKNVFASDHLFADDTPVPVLDPGRGRTKTGRLWVYAREQRGWGGPEPPAAVYLFAPDRKAERPASHLEHFRGVHVDGYAGFEPLAGKFVAPSASATDASCGAFRAVRPNWTRQRNSRLVAMPWRRQTCATATPGFSVMGHVQRNSCYFRENSPCRAISRTALETGIMRYSEALPPAGSC